MKIDTDIYAKTSEPVGLTQRQKLSGISRR
jgi:hypothetical protein